MDGKFYRYLSYLAAPHPCAPPHKGEGIFDVATVRITLMLVVLAAA